MNRTSRYLFLLLVLLLPASCGTESFEDNYYSAAFSPWGRISAAQPFVADLHGELSLPEALEHQVRHPIFDSLFHKYQQSHHFSGTVLLAEDGKIVHSGAYGFSDFYKKESLHLQSVFQLASVSKVFTATATLMLVEEGLISLHDPVKKYLPEFPYRSIKIRHLLSHRSGLCRYMGLGHSHWNKRYFLTNEKVIQLFNDQSPRLWFRPGTRFKYNNTNYAILASLIERVSGESFDQFLENRIFLPVGMHNTAAFNLLQQPSGFGQAKGYIRRGKRYISAGGDYLDGVMGDKGVFSTVLDLLKFDQALYSDQLLSQKTLKNAFRPKRPSNGKGYGYGWRSKSWMPGVVYHFGWWRGFRSCFIRDTKQNRTMIILNNRIHPKRPLNYWGIFEMFEKELSQK